MQLEARLPSPSSVVREQENPTTSRYPPLHHGHFVERGREGKLAVFCSLSWAGLEALMWEKEESSQPKGLQLKAWVGLGFPLWR